MLVLVLQNFARVVSLSSLNKLHFRFSYLLLSRTTVDSNFFHGPIEFEITRVNCTSAWLFSEINPPSERHRELFVGCWSLITSIGGNSHCNCPGLNNSLWWRSKSNFKKWNAILYKTNTYIFALRKTTLSTTTQFAVNNFFFCILFDFRIWIIHPGTVAMAISAYGSN
jgi:hypothetical protein